MKLSRVGQKFSSSFLVTGKTTVAGFLSFITNMTTAPGNWAVMVGWRPILQPTSMWFRLSVVLSVRPANLVREDDCSPGDTESSLSQGHTRGVSDDCTERTPPSCKVLQLLRVRRIQQMLSFLEYDDFWPWRPTYTSRRPGPKSDD
ncbi:uncharacterized protein LOC112574653 [Pomacea canaliculata]|uniref:uncharacterized protein LOC112574653 n=1 Tax=Pomacea canaliculata TaxID=400727 RepID=UPI000D72A087|nr:uncharacterized protein LOC112574653 [Pomacea canaliculata]